MTRDYAPPSTTKNQQAKTKKAASSTGGGSRRGKAKSGKPSRSKTPEPPKPNKFKLVSILLLLSIGFGIGLYLLQQLPETQSVKEGPATPKQEPSQATDETRPVEQPEQRFNFYKILPETEVVPPEVPTYTFKEKGAPKNYHYIIQTGSFRSQEDAERQKATIAFQGLKANITPSVNDQGTTWYRVSTGPFISRSKMNSALDKLANIGIDPLVKKVKTDG